MPTFNIITIEIDGKEVYNSYSLSKGLTKFDEYGKSGDSTVIFFVNGIEEKRIEPKIFTLHLTPREAYALKMFVGNDPPNCDSPYDYVYEVYTKLTNLGVNYTFEYRDFLEMDNKPNWKNDTLKKFNKFVERKINE